MATRPISRVERIRDDSSPTDSGSPRNAGSSDAVRWLRYELTLMAADIALTFGYVDAWRRLVGSAAAQGGWQ